MSDHSFLSPFCWGDFFPKNFPKGGGKSFCRFYKGPIIFSGRKPKISGGGADLGRKYADKFLCSNCKYSVVTAIFSTKSGEFGKKSQFFPILFQKFFQNFLQSEDWQSFLKEFISPSPSEHVFNINWFYEKLVLKALLIWEKTPRSWLGFWKITISLNWYFW